ncbi:amidase domain-containing protein [Clostridium thermarum]|uniref:amidase domain-containing protein n=1 Tax=Clostridium thermarum TaxID=1716543 RepID=UPI00111E8178|nr:amidase domain-containing protein [Clostridium thermarum]
MKKSLSALLILFLLVFLLPSSASAQSITSDTDIKTTVEKYFKTYNKILISKDTNDFELLESLFFNPQSNKTLNYELGRIKYLLTSSNLANASYENIESSYKYNSITSLENTITVDLEVTNSIKFSNFNDYQTITTPHKVILTNIEGELYICDDIYNDELKMLYGNDTDFTQPINDLINSSNLTNYTLQSSVSIKEPSVTIEPNAVPGDYYITYNRTNAVWYANYYTDNTGGNDGSSYNNAQFKYFSYGNDCQNFVSQCIWYGFGGRSSSAKDIPMDYYWWADKSSTAPTWYWTYVPYFLDYITANFKNNDYGVQGHATDVSNIQPGDYVYTPSHVLMVVSTDGTYAGTYVSAHTSNRLNVKLSSLYGSTQPSNMKFVHITKVKWNSGLE